jgi:DNA-binding HxlR family transcriptional regulator
MGKPSQASGKDALQPGPAADPEARRSYNHPCTIARTLDILGDRWTLLIIRDLMAGLHRYSEIQDSCHGVSPNVLSDRLKRLQRDGLVERRHTTGLPPQTEYILTEKGWSVRPILQSMIDWGSAHLGSLDMDEVGTRVSTDFAVRVIPTFAFKPASAEGVTATMVVEISECADCNTWTFEIRDGHIYPRRQASGTADVILRTDTSGFFAFIHNKLPPEDCGEIAGDPATAAAIQACFLTT